MPEPSAPLRSLNLFCRPAGFDGISVHARAMAEALRPRLDRLCVLKALRPDEAWFRRQEVHEGRPDPKGDSLVFYWPQLFHRYRLGRRRLGYSVFETPVLLAEDVAAMNGMDAMVTASAWGREVLRANGIKVPILLFRGGGTVVQAPRHLPEGVFRFLHIGKWERRKGGEQLIRCFNRAFEGRADVRLTLSVDNPHLKRVSAEGVLAELAKGLAHPVANIDILHHVPDLTATYLGHHCLVLPTRGEGIGLPVLEAMAHGLPCIVPLHTGLTEYASDANALLLRDLHPEPVFDPPYFPRSGEQGSWLVPGDDELIEALRYAVANPAAIEAVGQRAQRFVGQEFTWAKAADGFLDECARLLPA